MENKQHNEKILEIIYRVYVSKDLNVFFSSFGFTNLNNYLDK